jgi:hypothetical protein
LDVDFLSLNEFSLFLLFFDSYDDVTGLFDFNISFTYRSDFSVLVTLFLEALMNLLAEEEASL